jgi:ABC-type dipeptide/oligopeptide/nickel transport system permease subunit
MPRKQHGHQSQGSGVTRYEPFIGHAANKDSVSSLSFTATPGHLEHPGPDFVSPRVSLADSLTPLSGPGEQRSGWFSDDEDIEQGRVRGSGYADVGTREKQVDTQSRRVRKIKVIVGVSILVLLIVVGVVLGVVFGVQGKKDKIGRTVTRI